tara:strand:- start:2047 stop:2568 length:522 start_codon:yes stop_codon:yes gene_type:complete
MQKTIKFIIIIILIFILGIFFLALNKNTTYNTEHLVGNRLTNIKLNSFDNNEIISDKELIKNNFTLINFWASWCAPCKVEHSNLMKLSKEKNLKIIGVNFKDQKINALKFLNNLGNPYDFLARDNQGKQSIIFGIYGIPESILINKDLKIIKKIIGPINNNDLNDIKEIIKSL